MNNLPKLRPTFRLTATAIEKPLTRYIAVTPDDEEIEISSEQYDDNVYERGVPIGVQLGRNLKHIKSQTTWLTLASFPQMPRPNDGMLS